MSLSKRLLHLFFGKTEAPQPDIPFGRYSDAYKSTEQARAFNRSIALFDEGKHLEAYKTFLEYIREERGDNLSWKEENGMLEFQFWQGSRRIEGIATAEKLKAESKIAKAESLNVGFLRRLMEANFNLKFCRYALDEHDNICILFDTHTVDGAPHKLLYALRELAVNADKQDDLLINEFTMLRPVEPRLYGDIPEEEKEKKLAFIHREIRAAAALMEKGVPDVNRYPGAYAFYLLGLAFKLDYLVKPEGYMMDVLEKIHTLYFAQSNQSQQGKIQQILKEFQKLLDRPREEMFKEMYRTRSTFGINPAVNYGSVESLIKGELPNMDWPMQQNYPELSLAVPQYIAGFCLFHYAPPKPVKEVLHLFTQICEAPFFRELGFSIPFTDAEGRLQKGAILRAIQEIARQNRLEYPRLHFKTDKLDFGSIVLFGKTFMQMLTELDMTKEE